MSISFNTEAIAELEMMLLSNAEAIEKHAEDMLKAGGQIVADAHNKALERIGFSHRSTGDIVGSVRPGKMRKLKSGMGYALTVYPHDYQTHGFTRKDQRSLVSNAHAGFMLEYGTANMPARPWRDSADDEAADKVHEAMAAVWAAVSYG